jgi:hypothetical protein
MEELPHQRWGILGLTIDDIFKLLYVESAGEKGGL